MSPTSYQTAPSRVRIIHLPLPSRQFFFIFSEEKWLREPDLNRRPSGYEPDELPGCSIPRPYTTTIASVTTVHCFLFSRENWLREPDLNRRPSGYEPDELPGCSIPRPWKRTIRRMAFDATPFAIKVMKRCSCGYFSPIMLKNYTERAETFPAARFNLLDALLSSAWNSA